MAKIDNGPWDGNAAMTACETAADYEAICAGRRAGEPSQRQTWALPHHAHPGDPPNADGVRASLSRFGQTEGLTNREEAQRHLDAHMADIQAAAETTGRAELPPRENLVRMLMGDSLRAELDGDHSDGRLGTLYGRLMNFNQWAEVNSTIEGHFMEITRSGAATKTFAENRSRMQVVFDHGQDRGIGRKPLGPLEDVSITDDFVDYQAALIDTSYNRDLIPGLRAGLYGNSYRFDVPTGKVRWNDRPTRSADNPQGLPEAVISEMRIKEFGPTPFPVYAGTSAGVRSMTDDYLLRQLTVRSEPGPDPTPEPEPGPDPTPELAAVEPAIVMPPPPVVVVPAAPIRRFRSNAEWIAYLTKR